jgi:sugar phosphate isomerase/epimerase
MSKNKVIRTPILAVAAVILSTVFTGCANDSNKPNSNFNGVTIGVISYSWRSMPSAPQDIINYCVQAGIYSIELMGNVVEANAGAPGEIKQPRNFEELPEEEKAAIMDQREESLKKLAEWRLSNAPAEKYKELRTMFDEAGIKIHTVKFAPAKWSDDEVDYAFDSAKILGAKGITNEIGHEAAKRLGPFAEKHDMYAVFHNHGQPGDPDFNFEEFLAYSPNNMLNLDVGHYFGATGKHPNDLIEKLHDRIYSIHMKDKTGKDADPADTNMPWGEGDTPLEDILKLIQKNKWDIKCDVELEYQITEGSDAIQETTRCVEYCKNILI